MMTAGIRRPDDLDGRVAVGLLDLSVWPPAAVPDDGDREQDPDGDRHPREDGEDGIGEVADMSRALAVRAEHRGGLLAAAGKDEEQDGEE